MGGGKRETEREKERIVRLHTHTKKTMCVHAHIQILSHGVRVA